MPARTTLSGTYSVKRTAEYTFWICTLLVLLGGTGRLLWHASRTETGLETLRFQWRDATWGMAVGKRTPIHSQEPMAQAHLWLDELDRILHHERNDAELTMGAALVLDSPSPEYVSKYLKRIRIIPGFGTIPELDEERLKAAKDAFESLCKEKCLQMAAKATELEPTNVEWWRLRALLLRSAMHSYDELRTDNWLEILQEASEHDGDNALYDYLAAHFYWESSAEMDFNGANERLVVLDAERFNRGISHFEQGQKKPYFAVGDTGFLAAAKFLSETTIPITDSEKIVNSRLIHLRRISLLRGVLRWQDMRAIEVADGGDSRKALAMQRKNLRMIDQFTGVGTRTKYDNIAIHYHVFTTDRMHTLANEHKESFPAAVIEDVKALEERARLTKKVVEQAARELSNNRANRRQSGTTLMDSPAEMIRALVVGISPSLVVILVSFGLLAMGVSRIGSDHDVPKLGVFGHSLSLAAAFISTVVVFALAPAKIISPPIQAWGLTTLLIVSPLVLVLWIGWTWLRRRAFRFSLRATLTWVFAFNVLFGIVAMARPSAESFAQLPFDLSIPARGWEGLDATSLENALRPSVSWLWPVIQWTVYRGEYLTVAVWAAVAAFVLRFKVRRFRDGPPLTFANFLGVWTRSLGHAFLTLSALVTILYLSFTPAVVAEVEREFQDKMEFARRPSAHWSEVERAVQRVRSNPESMEQLRAAVKTEIAEE